MAEQWSRTPEYQRRFIQRGYVEIFGDACEALDFLTLSPETQRRPEFMDGFKQAGSDLEQVDYALMIDRRLTDWIKMSSATG